MCFYWVVFHYNLNYFSFLCEHTKLREATISFVCRSVCPLVGPHGTTPIPLGQFSWNLILQYVSQICRENSSFIKIGQEQRVLYMKTSLHFWSYLNHFFLQWEMFQTNVVEKINTHVLCSVTFFRKSCRLWDNVENVCKAGQTTQYGTRALRAG